jgi:hypothetical protein
MTSDWASNRIYALTRRNRIVTGFFVALTSAQVMLGMVFLASPDNSGQYSDPPHIRASADRFVAIQLPEIKIQPYYICMFASNIRLESAYTSLSLAFDFCAFIAIVASAYKFQFLSPGEGFRLTGVIGTVVRDSTVYFTVIFTSHLTLTMFIFFARVCIRNLICASVSHGLWSFSANRRA